MSLAGRALWECCGTFRRFSLTGGRTPLGWALRSYTEPGPTFSASRVWVRRSASLLFLVPGLSHQHGYRFSGTVSQDTFSLHRFFLRGLYHRKEIKRVPSPGCCRQRCFGITRADYLWRNPLWVLESAEGFVKKQTNKQNELSISQGTQLSGLLCSP